MDCGPASGRPSGSARRDHRPGRTEDGHQWPQFRRQRVHGGLRRFAVADLGQRDQRASRPEAGGGGYDPPRRSRHGQGVWPRGSARDPHGEAARLAPRGEAPRSGRSSGAGRPVRFRPVLLPQRPPAPGAGFRTLFLPAEAAESSRGSSVERRVPVRPEGIKPAAGKHPGDRADRDAARCAGDGRDTVRAARSLGRAQFRPLGLHLLLHQDPPRRRRGDPAGPGAGDHGPAVPARLPAASHPDLPPARRPRHGRNGRPDPDQERPGSEPRRAREGSCRQMARGEPRPRRSLGGPPRSRSGDPGGVRHLPAGPQPNSPEATGGRRGGGGSPAPAAGDADGGGPAPQRARGSAVPRGVAAGNGVRAPLSPDGGCRHRRDFEDAGVAVDPSRRLPVRGSTREPRLFPEGRNGGDGAPARRSGAAALRGREISGGVRSLRAALDLRDLPRLPHSPGLRPFDGDPPIRHECRRNLMYETGLQPETNPDAVPATPTPEIDLMAGCWDGITRTYSPEDVRRLRGSVRIEHTLAQMGARRLWHLLHTEDYVPALGAVTGNQAVQQVRAGLDAIYCSGWQVAADANTQGSTYPDQSLYPVDSVPRLVRRINQALQRADQIEHAEGRAGRYWYAPIVADAEAGFGGPLNAFELMKAMIEAGAAGVHFEDQLSSEKKCGHLGGKVLLPTGQFIRTLVAARLAADVMGVPTILVARTDADSAKLITSDVDPRDRPFLAGERTPEGFFRLKGGLDCAIARGLAYAPYADLLWCETSTPDIAEARRFAESIHARFPGKLLAYNCSPS